MEWYLPITIIPGVGVLIVSTTNQLLGVNEEIRILLREKCDDFQKEIITLKIVQLGKLTHATFFLYLSCSFFVCSGIVGAFLQMNEAPNVLLICGTVSLLISLAILIVYGYKQIIIRKKQFNKIINKA